MATKIPWCDETLNVTAGCTKCSPGCLNCYAERMAKRLAGMEEKAGREPRYGAVVDNKGWMGNVICDESLLDKPLHWKKPRRIFIDSMSDLFHPKVPFEFIDKVLDMAIKAYIDKGHTLLFLTKRPERMGKEFATWSIARGNNLSGIYGFHLGVSISNPDEMWKANVLADIPAAVRFISFEPLLENVGVIRTAGIHGTIVGCESGPKRRPCKMEWIYGIINQCRDSGIPCFVKQINLNGEVVKMPEGFPQEIPIVK